MHPTVYLGPLTLSTYTVLLDAGLLASFAILVWRARRRVAQPERWLYGAVAALVVGVAGGRVGYVMGHLTYFRQHPGEVARFWLGGLSWHGALAGAVLALLVASWLLGFRFWRLADEVALVAPLIGAAGWLGCLAVGCAYGRAGAGPAWLQADLPDLYGVSALRPNVQLLAAAWSLVPAPLLVVAHRRGRDGLAAGLWLALTGVGLTPLSPLRGDAIPLWAGWRLDLWFNGLVAAAGILIVGLRAFRSRQP
jgi:phosphatidylglycerol:prolipoprotein diacylglycerol transferase